MAEINNVLKNRIMEFNDWYDPEGSKKMLWELFRAATVGNFCKLSKLERDNLASFYERLEELLPAVHAVAEDYASTLSGQITAINPPD